MDEARRNMRPAPFPKQIIRICNVLAPSFDVTAEHNDHDLDGLRDIPHGVSSWMGIMMM